MPKTGESPANRKARMNKKVDEAYAVYHSEAGKSLLHEPAAYRKLTERRRILIGDVGKRKR